jgi:hypothetical protein
MSWRDVATLGEVHDRCLGDCPHTLRVVDETQDWRRKTLRCLDTERHEGEHRATWDGNEARWSADSASLSLVAGDWSIDNTAFEVT